MSLLMAKAIEIENEVTNPNFDDASGWSVGNASISVNDNTAIITASGANTYGQIFQVDENLVGSPGDKWFIFSRVRVTNALCSQLELAFSGTTVYAQTNIKVVSTPLANEFYEMFGIATVTTQTGYFRTVIAHIYPDSATANGKVMEVEGSPARGGGVFVIKMTGTQHEDKTADQMWHIIKQRSAVVE